MTTTSAVRAGRPAAMAALCGAALLVAGCAGPPADPNGAFSVETFFQGETVSRGEIRTLSFWSEPFTASFKGSGAKGTLSLEEHFAFRDGDPMQVWNLSADAEGLLSGTVKTGLKTGQYGPTVPVEGYRTGHGVVLNYDGYAPGGGSTVLHFRHRMESLGDGTVSNDVVISKFGIPLAHADVIFSKPKRDDAPGQGELP